MSSALYVDSFLAAAIITYLYTGWVQTVIPTYSNKIDNFSINQAEPHTTILVKNLKKTSLFHDKVCTLKCKKIPNEPQYNYLISGSSMILKINKETFLKLYSI